MQVARLPVGGGLLAEEQRVEAGAAAPSQAAEVALLALREGLADGDGELGAEREKLALQPAGLARVGHREADADVRVGG